MTSHWVNGRQVTFRIDASDPTRRSDKDTFRLRWAGFDAGGNVHGGGVEVDPA